MNNFLNRPEAFMDEMVDGILEARPGHLRMAAGSGRCLAPGPEAEAARRGGDLLRVRGFRPAPPLAGN